MKMKSLDISTCCFIRLNNHGLISHPQKTEALYLNIFLKHLKQTKYHTLRPKNEKLFKSCKFLRVASTFTTAIGYGSLRQYPATHISASLVASLRKAFFNSE